MGKNDWDSDLDNDNNYNSYDFDDYGDRTSDNRRPVKAAVRSISKLANKALITGSGATFNRTKDHVGRAMPESTNAFNQISGAYKDARSIISETSTEIGKITSSLRNSLHRALPVSKNILPASIYDKIDRMLKTDKREFDVDTSKQIEAQREDQIARTISETFLKTQQIEKATREESRINKLVDRQISMGQFEHTRKHLHFISTFLNTSFTAYLKKSIELKYKHLFIAQDTLTVTKAMATIIETKLESIKHNTGLPEIQKLQGIEGIKSAGFSKLYGAVAGGLSNKASDWISKGLKNVKTGMIDTVLSQVTMMADQVDWAADMVEQMSDMNEMEMMDRQDPKTKAIKWVVDQLSKRGGKKIADKYAPDLLRILTPLIRTSEGFAKNADTKALFKLMEFQRNQDMSSGFMSNLMSHVLPSIDNKYVTIDNSLAQNAAMAAVFDRLSRQTLVEIIPGWLAKIAKNTRDIATGRNTEEEVYDFNTRDFTTVSNFRKHMEGRIFGSIESRAHASVTGISIISSSYTAKSRRKIDFNAIRKDLAIFIDNHVATINLVNPKAIAYYTDNLDIEEDVEDGVDEGKTSLFKFFHGANKETVYENYITDVFDGIQDKKRLANIIYLSLFTPSGEVDIEIVSSLNNSITDQAHQKGVHEEFLNLFEVHGHRRHFKDVMQGTTIKHDYLRGQRLKGLNSKAATDILNDNTANYLRESLQRDSDISILREKALEHNIGMFDAGTYIGDLLERGVLSDRAGVEATLEVLDKHGLFSATDDDTIDSSDTTTVGKSGRRRKKRSKVVRRPNSKYRKGQVNVGNTFIDKTVSGIHNNTNTIVDILSNLIDNKTVSTNTLNTPGASTITSNLQSENQILHDIRGVLDRFHSDSVELSFTSLDYLIKIHDKVLSNNIITADDLAKFNILKKLGIDISKHKGKFSSIKTSIMNTLGRGWNKLKYRSGQPFEDVMANIPVTKTGLLKRAGMGIIGGSMLGPLGLLLGLNWGNNINMFSQIGSAAKNIGTSLWNRGKEFVTSKWGDVQNSKEFQEFAERYRAIAGNVSLDTLKSEFNKLKARGRDVVNRGKARVAKVLFIDVYRADKIEPGNPLITAKQQENKEVVFSDGKPIITSYLINRPVIRVSDTQTVISEEDIKAGLTDVSGTPLDKLSYVKSKFNFKIPKLPSFRGGDGSGFGLSGPNKGMLLGGGLGALLTGSPLGAILGGLLGRRNSGLFTGKNVGGLLGLSMGGIPGALLGYLLGGAAGKLSGIPGALIGAGARGISNIGGFLSDKLGFKAGSRLFGRLAESKADKDAKSVKLVQRQFKSLEKLLTRIERNTRDGYGDSGSGLFRGRGRLGRRGRIGRGGRLGGLIGGALGLSDILGLGGGAFGSPSGLPGGFGGGDILDIAGTAADVATSGGKGGLLGRGLSAAGRGIGTLGRGAFGLGRGAVGLAARAIPLAVSGASAAWAGVSSLAAGAAGVLAAIPVAGWIALAVVAAGVAAYGLYKYMQPSKGSDELLKARIEKYGASSVSNIKQIRSLENRIHEFIINKAGPLGPKELKKYASKLGLGKSDPIVARFHDWLTYTFIPRFGAYLKVVEQHGKKYDEMKKISAEDPSFETIKKDMISEMDKIPLDGPLFSEIMTPQNDEKDDASIDTVEGDSDTREGASTPVSNAINKVDNYGLMQDITDDLDNQEGGTKRSAIENYRPKDTLYKLISDGNDKQLQALNKIHDEIRIIREAVEWYLEDDPAESFMAKLSGVTSSTINKFKSVVGIGGSRNSTGKKATVGGATFHEDVVDATAHASVNENVSARYLLTTALIESGGGYNTYNQLYPNIKGAWQITPGTAEFMRVHPGEMDNPMSNATVAARYYKWLKQQLRKYHMPTTDDYIYLAHQQGPGGARALYKLATEGGFISESLRDNMDNNGGRGMSPSEFISFILNKYRRAAAKVDSWGDGVYTRYKNYLRDLSDYNRSKLPGTDALDRAGLVYSAIDYHRKPEFPLTTSEASILPQIVGHATVIDCSKK